eukprot:EG_transcript_37381
MLRLGRDGRVLTNWTGLIWAEGNGWGGGCLAVRGVALGGLGEARRLKPKAAVGACDGWTKPTFQGPMDGKSESDGMGRNDEVHAWPIDSGRRHCKLQRGEHLGDNADKQQWNGG